MKLWLAFAMSLGSLFSGSVFAIDESLSLSKLPVGTVVELNLPDVEMVPNTSFSRICVESKMELAMLFNETNNYRYLPSQKIVAELVKPISSDKGSQYEVLFCGIRDSGCQFTFSPQLSEISFRFFREDGYWFSISSFRKFIESCNGTLTIPAPVPYP